MWGDPKCKIIKDRGVYYAFCLSILVVNASVSPITGKTDAF